MSAKLWYLAAMSGRGVDPLVTHSALVRHVLGVAGGAERPAMQRHKGATRGREWVSWGFVEGCRLHACGVNM